MVGHIYVKGRFITFLLVIITARGGEVLRTEQTKSKRMERTRYQWEQMLEQMSSAGVTLYVDNRVARPKDIAARTVREDSPYMADFVFGDAGELVQLRFDRLRR